MPAYKRKKDAEASPILTRKNRPGADGWTEEQMQAVAKLAVAAAMKGNATYISPTRFGSLVFKVYIEGEQYAETLNPGDEWDALAEDIIGELYDLDTVAKVRRAFATRPQEAPGGPTAAPVYLEQGRKARARPGPSEEA